MCARARVDISVPSMAGERQGASEAAEEHLAVEAV